MIGRPLRERVADALLGADPDNRRRARRGLLSLCGYGASLAGEALGIAFGLTDAGEAAMLCAYLIAGIVCFFALTRSGLNRRFADPTLTTPHVLFALSAVFVAYPVHGPFRGLNLFAAAVPPLFGFLTVSRRTGLAIVGGTTVAFGLLMLALVLADPVRFDPRIESLHFAILAICMSALGALLWQIAGMRDRIRARRIELSLALERIEAISTRDELTGVFNRRYMTARLDDEAERRARGGPPFSVCLLDIDFFKQINDLHGHARGDTVLRGFARIVQAGVRESDVLARWGGEEFLLLLPATDAPAAAELVERLRRHCAESADWEGDAPLRPRFSAGVAEDEASTIAAVVERADAALYRAKAAGRDCVVVGASRSEAEAST